MDGIGKYVKFLEELQKEHRLNPNQMAIKLGIAPQTYHYYLKEARGMKVEFLIKVKRRFGLSWSKLGAMLEKEVDDEK